MAVTRKKRRIRSPHPGVVLVKPDAGHPYWRARFADPDTDRFVKVRLNPLAISTLEARRVWAVQKSKALAKRRMEIESGAPRSTGTTLSAALKRYFDAHTTLRPRTLEIYRNAVDKLEAWAEKVGIGSADGLNRARLLSFRDALVREPKRVAAKGKGRGQRVASRKPRSAAAVNQELRAVRTVLGYVRDLDLFPRLTHDDLRRALKRLPAVHERIEFLKPTECRSLLDAALRHDAAMFVATRNEHAGRRRAGTTPRYQPVAPFSWFLLATGMRFGEAFDLDWKSIDLEALDNEGRVVGEIHLGGAYTKTKHARTVGLEVSPALYEMLSEMHRVSGGKGRVFKLTRGEADAAVARLKRWGAPESFTWQVLRRTCGTFLTNAPGIFGAASAYRSAKQLGHSVQVAEKHYLGLVRGIPRDARTLEAAMQIENLLSKLTASVSFEVVPELPSVGLVLTQSQN